MAGPIKDIFGGIIGWKHGKKPISILKANPADVEHMIVRNHYSHKVCPNSFCSLFVHHDQFGVTGAIQIGYGIRPKKKPEGVVEFDRMWLSDTLPKFSETIVLSMLHKFLFHAYPQIHTLRSYADTSAGNDGTIYRAGNYVEIKRINADFYIMPDGERVHPVTMWHRHKTRSKAFLNENFPGWRKASGQQICFEYYIRPAVKPCT